MHTPQKHDLSANRRDRMATCIRNLCDAVGDFIEYWGFKAIHGKVWALLALRRNPMSQTEIADFLAVSRSLVNGAIRELTDYGLVQPIREHRNSPYRAVVDIWPTISDILREREWVLIANAKMAVESAIEEAEFGINGAVAVELFGPVGLHIDGIGQDAFQSAVRAHHSFYFSASDLSNPVVQSLDASLRVAGEINSLHAGAESLLHSLLIWLQEGERVVHEEPVGSGKLILRGGRQLW